MFVLDNREHALIKLLPTAQVRQLPIADIWLGVQADASGQMTPMQGAVLIERKSVRDLEASYMDGRYREQRQRLLSYCQQTGAQPLYIIEGSFYSSTGRMAPKDLMKAVVRLQTKHRIGVLQTSSTAETSQAIEALWAYWQADPSNFQPTQEQARAIDTIHVNKKVNALEPRAFGVAALAQIPGVSTRLADEIVAHFPSFHGLLSATDNQIAEIRQANGRRIGPAVAKRIVELLRASWSSPTTAAP